MFTTHMHTLSWTHRSEYGASLCSSWSEQNSTATILNSLGYFEHHKNITIEGVVALSEAGAVGQISVSLKLLWST